MSRSGAKNQPANSEAGSIAAVDPAKTHPPKAARKPQRPRDRKPPQELGALPLVDRATEDAVGVTVDELTALYILDALRGFGPQKFKELHAHNLSNLSLPSGRPERKHPRQFSA
jgi:hypothetical protein